MAANKYQEEFVEYLHKCMDKKEFPTRLDCWNAAIKLVEEKSISTNNRSDEIALTLENMIPDIETHMLKMTVDCVKNHLKECIAQLRASQKTSTRKENGPISSNDER